jgi:hypothetical protein
MWIDVEDASGTKLGSGPIVSATGWQQRRRMNQAGEFGFVMPANDPQVALLAGQRVVRCWNWDVIRGAYVVGAGVIERIRTTVAPDGTALLDVSGGDLLRQLSTRTVGMLDLFVDTGETPSRVSRVNPGETVLTNAFDGNVATSDAVTLTGTTGAPADWIYVAQTSTFHAVAFTLGAAKNNNAATLGVQFYRIESGGYGWETGKVVSDGTASGGATLAQSGTVEIETPRGWEKLGSAYVMRFFVSANLDAVDFAEVQTKTERPTATALADVMAYAPSPWALDGTGYSATASTVYLTFAGESVLTALIRIAETTGENFIGGTTQEVKWLRADQTASGLRAVAGVDPLAGEDNDDIVLITNLRAVPDTDATGICSRVLCWGGGVGGARPTLADCTRTPPAGYTLSTTSNYLKCDAAETAYGRIEYVLTAPDVVAADTTPTQKQQASNTLYDRALTYLQRHNAPLQNYAMDVVKAHAELTPGQTIRLVYHEWAATYHAVNINADLWILETAEELAADGKRLTGLSLSNVVVYPPLQNGADMLVTALEDLKSGQGASPPQAGVTSFGRGVPHYLTVENGQVTQVFRTEPIGDGIYDIGVGPLGNMGEIHVTNGIITAITEPT